MARTASEKPGRVWLRRLAWIGGGIAVLVFTIEGGEYGTRDLWTQSSRKAKLDADVAQLKLEVDSLRQELKVLKTDDARLERIARERYGMVKGSKELLYWVSSGVKTSGDTAVTTAVPTPAAKP
jgi:cell division protein FtsB